MSTGETEVKENKIGFLFDLDGVLIDSENEYTKIWCDIESVFPTGIDNFAIKIKGCTLPEILETHFPKNQHKEIINMLNEREQKMRYKPLPGALRLLKYLNEANIGCVLVTSSNGLKMRHLREELPILENYFFDIVTADRIKHSKPDPEGYLLGANLLGADPKRCVVFEDSLQGVKAGKAAGCYVVGLKTTLPAQTLSPYADLIINDLSDLNILQLQKELIER